MVARFVSLLLLRHGQSEWNAVRRWQGLADSPLSDLGRQQAANAATALSAIDPASGPFGSVWSSPLARAAETGSIISDHLDLGDVRVDERLREADAGEWQGLTPDEIDAAYPGFLAGHLRPPTFEPGHEVVARSLAAVADIAETGSSDGDAIVVTTHSGVIRSLARHLGATDERIPNLGGIWLSVTTDRSATGASLGVDLRGRFDPKGVVRTGVDAPGEDPGEQPDQTEDHGGTER
jgi:probable phosphoglycerate mutase